MNIFGYKIFTLRAGRCHAFGLIAIANMAIITLTTDFGTSDEYAGLLKAAILSVDASATVVDITHGIDPQDVCQAAFVIESASRYFPESSIHIVVVDPGVGTDRAVIGLAKSGRYFIAPDNGVLSLVLDCDGPQTIVRLENRAYFRDQISSTFHGRDIMAPAAAHVGCGVALAQLGPEIEPDDLCIDHDLLARAMPDGHIQGRIVAVDHFGNLITNIRAVQLREAGYLNEVGEKAVRVMVAEQHCVELMSRYADAAPNAPLALIGSRGFLEIAVNSGSARMDLNAEKGSPVRVFFAGK